jgi:hypothetical protein
LSGTPQIPLGEAAGDAINVYLFEDRGSTS